MYNIVKANAPKRQWVMQRVASYLNKTYPGAFDESLGIYADFKAFVNERDGHLVGGILFRVDGDTGELHAVADNATFSDPKARRAFAEWLGYQGELHQLSEFRTLVRKDNFEVQDALMACGFDMVPNPSPLFNEYRKEV